MRRRLAAIGVALAAVVPASAGAESAEAVGWWWRPQSETVVLPAPPHVAEGELWVARDATDDLAVAAVRAVVAFDATATDLVLQAARVDGDPSSLVACQATTAWKPVEGGAWDVRPEADCGSALAPLTVDGTTFRFDLARLGLAAGEVVDVVLLTDPSATSKPVFSVTFTAPDADADAIAVVTPSRPSPRPAPTAVATPVPSRPAAAIPYTPPPLGFAPDLDEPTAEVAAQVAAPVAPTTTADPAAATDPGTRRPVLALLLVVGVAVLWGSRAAVVQRDTRARHLAMARFAGRGDLHDVGAALLDRRDVEVGA